MLAVASPIALTSPSNFPHSKDADGAPQPSRGSGLDAILSDKIEFVEGSSTGALAQGEAKYPYINVSSDESARNARPPLPAKPLANGAAPTSPFTPDHSIYSRPIITTWVMKHQTSPGFINTGNTCFLNSVLQCLIHTPPLQHLLNQHGSPDDKCRVSDNFCMACKLRDTMKSAFLKREKPFIPTQVVGNLHRIAKHMHRGRQEDAHEFLRYSVDALQRSCLAGYPPKLDTKIAQTTWVHRLFGGRLRSRVTCSSCGHPSDTFDAILDLSLDIQSVGSLKQAIAKFVQVDHLRGANKYKCERCKKMVNAEKQFTVHDAPVCLTVHLKRFTPLGRKISHTIEYGHTLELQPAMSEGQHGPRYALYAVISHAGSGPNSGHYYAHVKGPDGFWYDANDESVIRTTSSTVVGRKNAYMLFYMRMQGDALGAAINLHGANGLKKGMKREMPEDDDEDRGVPANGTAAPASSPVPQKKPALDKSSPLSPRPYPQAVKLQERIAKVTADKGSTLRSNVSLVPYSSDGEEEEHGEGREATPAPEKSSPPSVPPSSSSVAPGARYSSPIEPASFYGNAQPVKKRKSFSGSDDDAEHGPNEAKRHRSSPPSETQRRDKQQLAKRMPGTPFTSSSMSNNLHEARGGPSQEQGHGFNPPRRGPPQQIASVGHKVFHPKGSKFAARMKPRTRTMI
ncbi:hypothetical protein JB92DRAFT_2724825 [Gautieria morchelliformis]|nr:hypothetical protein JB92DRAFT_2724825 [Gautieria morchelliformis]